MNSAGPSSRGSAIVFRDPVALRSRALRGRTQRMYYVYVLLSQKDGKLYTGLTNDRERRLKEHRLGKVISTKSRRPLRLIYYEAYIDKRACRR